MKTPRKTPAEIKGWLEKSCRSTTDMAFKRAALAYIKSLENIVACYTKRDGKLEE